ncbi:MAG: type 1 glutamine amidotransferase [Chthonomonadales bacterium]
MNILIIQHAEFETAGAILPWAAERNHAVQVVHPYAGESLPEVHSFDMLILLGGPMSVHDEASLPWLVDEKRLTKDALESKRLVVGICFGSQILAEALGGKVFSNEDKEIGWHPIYRTMSFGSHRLLDAVPELQSVFHWHGETFSLPGGALLVASSNCCTNQLFTYGTRALGIQFHPEMTAEVVKAMCENCAEDLLEAPYVQSEEQMLSYPDRFVRNHKVLYDLFDGFVTGQPTTDQPAL